MLVTVWGMSNDTRLPHAMKDWLPMAVTLLGMTVDVLPMCNVLVAVWMIALQFSRESYTGLSSATIMLWKLERANAPCEIFVKLLGI